MEMSSWLHTLATLPPRERSPVTHWIGGWVSCRASLEVVVNKKNLQPLPGLEPPVIQPIALSYSSSWWTVESCILHWYFRFHRYLMDFIQTESLKFLNFSVLEISKMLILRWRVSHTEHYGWMVSTSVLHLGDPRHNSQHGNWLSWLGFLWFYLVLPRKCRVSTLKVGHDCYLPHSSQSIIHCHPVISV
jgi:hypothetical protein